MALVVPQLLDVIWPSTLGAMRSKSQQKFKNFGGQLYSIFQKIVMSIWTLYI
jgi:hypothetical protein